MPRTYRLLQSLGGPADVFTWLGDEIIAAILVLDEDRCRQDYKTMTKAKFTIGQIIHHKLFDYRGVIVDVDFRFSGTDDWYESVARTRPSKNQPWYRVLVDHLGYETYVAEQNMEPSTVVDPIHHELVSSFFDEFKDGSYVPKARTN
ncbi:MAG: heat shock protein HspQ [Pseudomonadota bacterium]